MPQGPPYYLTAGDKWLPLYLPPQDRQSAPVEYDELGHRLAPKPPPGKAVYWWLQPRETWPYRDEMPWESKNLGCWPSSKVSMWDDQRYIWPPPWGYIKLKMPGTPDISGDQGPKGYQIPLTHWRIHTRYLSPDEVRVMTAITPLGPRYYFQAKGWEQHEFDYKEFRRVLRMKRRASVQAMLAEIIAKGEQSPKRDLFE